MINHKNKRITNFPPGHTGSGGIFYMKDQIKSYLQRLNHGGSSGKCPGGFRPGM